MNEPLVSIIVPTFNRAHIIGKTLDSVLNQTYSNWECIVVDDGSIDETEELLASYSVSDSRFKYHKRPLDKIKGASSCRNIGLSKAEGEYVIFLDSDDLLISSCLENREKRRNEYPNHFFWVFPMIIQNDENKRLVSQIPNVEDFLVEFLSSKIHWQTMCTFWDINFLRHLGGFNENYPRLNDPELHIRALLEANGNYKVFSDDKPDSIYVEDVKSKINHDFALKYNKSLCLLVPNTVKKLKQTNNENYIPLLKAYLKNYMKLFFKLNTRKNNIKLFKCFYDNRVLSLAQFLEISVLYYAFFIFNLCLEKTKSKIDKFF